MATSKKRIGNPARKARRAASFKRSDERKAAIRKAQDAAERRNRALRADGIPTPYEARREAHRAKRAALLEAGEIQKQPRNERGFIIETIPGGHTVLRDPGDWHKRRKIRFQQIATGLITSSGETIESRPTGNGRAAARRRGVSA